MKIYKCRVIATGEIINQWTEETGDINYREPCFSRKGPFEVIEDEDFPERKRKFKALKDSRDAVKAETFADAFEDFILKEVPPYTQKQVRDYRQALKNVTDPYKNWKDDPESAARLDALVIEDFVWPVIK